MWKTIESRPVVSSRYVNVLKNAIQLPSGETIDDYYTVTIPEASAIVAITEEGKLVLKTEYRYACGEDLIEIPAGGIEKGESPLQAAQRELLEETGCDMVMIGRGALGNPWIFRELDAAYRGEEIPSRPSDEERIAMMIRHLEMLCDLKGEITGVKEFRKYIMRYTKGMRGAASMRRRANDSVSLRDMK